MEKCPIAKIIDVLGRKWMLWILKQLGTGKKRFNELQKEVHGISPRTLSKRLTELGKEGLVVKKEFNEVPPRVEYSLTEPGKELIACFKSLNTWVKKWRTNQKVI